MPQSNFDEELNTPRLVEGERFLRHLASAHAWLEQLNIQTDILLALRQEVQNNDPPIFESPGDLQFVNTKLIELKQAIINYINSLPGEASL